MTDLKELLETFRAQLVWGEAELGEPKTTRQKIARLNYRYTRLLEIMARSRNSLNAHWRLRHCQLGKFVQVAGNPRVFNRGELVVGDKVIIESVTARTELVCNAGARLEIGARTFINYGTSISAHQLVRIGERCRIGTYCNIADNDFHGIEDRMTLPPSGPVVLEENVWLGAKVIVLKGVTIGHDSVIGAGSVVTKNIPPRSVAVGLPAKVIRTF